MNFSFDARSIKPSEGGTEIWPGGRYPLVITAGEVKPTREQGGQRLSLTAECIDGPMKGKKTYLGFNLVNASQEAVRISFEQLSALCWVLNSPVINSYNDFFGRPFTAFNKPNDQGNNWQNFQTMDGRSGMDMATGQPPKQGQAQGQAQPGATPNGAAPQGAWQPGASAPMGSTTSQPAWGGGAPQGATPAPNGPAPGWQGGAQPAPQGAPAWGGGAPQAQPPQGAPAPAWGAAAPAGAAPQQWQAPGAPAAPAAAPAGWQPGGAPQPGAAPAWGR
jgi:hypothetical protein